MLSHACLITSSTHLFGKSVRCIGVSQGAGAEVQRPVYQMHAYPPGAEGPPSTDNTPWGVALGQTLATPACLSPRAALSHQDLPLAPPRLRALGVLWVSVVMLMPATALPLLGRLPSPPPQTCSCRYGHVLHHAKAVLLDMSQVWVTTYMNSSRFKTLHL